MMNEEQAAVVQPIESYQFRFSREELAEIDRLRLSAFYKMPVIVWVVGVFLAVYFYVQGASELGVGFLFGLLVTFAVAHIKGFFAYRKNKKTNMEKIPQCTYTYDAFSDHIRLRVYRDGEKIREARCDYPDIQQMQNLGKWLLLQFGGQIYILRTEELRENSVFFSYMRMYPGKSKVIAPSNKWKTAGDVLVVLSLLTLAGGVLLMNGLYGQGGVFTEYMWVFFLLIPIPVASIVIGLVLKAKGCKYKNNVIIGVVMAILLCIFGSFSFVFADMHANDRTTVLRVQELTGVQIPETARVSTQEWEQTVSGSYVHYFSHVYFGRDTAKAFEKQLAADAKWLAELPKPLVGIASPMNDHPFYDYILIYNVDTHQYNALPTEEGTYRFITLQYDLDEDSLSIVEYDLEYIQ